MEIGKFIAIQHLRPKILWKQMTMILRKKQIFIRIKLKEKTLYLVGNLVSWKFIKYKTIGQIIKNSNIIQYTKFKDKY